MANPASRALAIRLRAWTKDHDPHVRAAVELLITQDVWLNRGEFTAACVGSGRGESWIDWDKAAAFAAAGPGSMTEVAVLRLAVAIGSDQFRLSRIDRHAAAIVEAVATALGMEVTVRA